MTLSRQTIEVVAFTIAQFGSAHFALADDIDSIIDRFDSLQMRDQNPAEGAHDVVHVGSGANVLAFSVKAKEEVAPKDWKFSASLPTSYSSNPTRVDSRSRDAGHTAPSAKLSWTKEYGAWQVTALAGVNYDVYTSHSVDGSSSGFGNFQIVYGDPTKRIVPTISYAPSAIFEEFIGDHTVTAHDMYAGINRNFDIKFEPSVPAINVTIDLGFTRREASVANAEQNRATKSRRFRVAASLRDQNLSRVVAGIEGESNQSPTCTNQVAGLCTAQRQSLVYEVSNHCVMPLFGWINSALVGSFTQPEMQHIT